LKLSKDRAKPYDRRGKTSDKKTIEIKTSEEYGKKSNIYGATYIRYFVL